MKLRIPFSLPVCCTALAWALSRLFFLYCYRSFYLLYGMHLLSLYLALKSSFFNSINGNHCFWTIKSASFIQEGDRCRKRDPQLTSWDTTEVRMYDEVQTLALHSFTNHINMYFVENLVWQFIAIGHLFLCSLNESII